MHFYFTPYIFFHCILNVILLYQSVPQGGGASAFNFSSAPGPVHPPSTASFTTPLSTAMTSMTSPPMNAGSAMTNVSDKVDLILLLKDACRTVKKIHWNGPWSSTYE